MTNQADGGSATKSVAFKPVIFYVDDERSLLNVMGNLLRATGYEVTTDQDPVHALETLRSYEGPIDLFLFNYLMPGMNGVQLSRNVYEIQRWGLVPVVISSAIHEDTIVEKEKDLPENIRAFLHMPGDVDNLTGVLDKTIQGSREEGIMAHLSMGVVGQEGIYGQQGYARGVLDTLAALRESRDPNYVRTGKDLAAVAAHIASMAGLPKNA